MKTQVVAALYERRRRSQTAATDQAVELLRAGEVVALPTETVYGLAADALNEAAVVKIFEAKERPRFDPLIIHLPQKEWLERVTEVSAQDQQLVSELTNAFWPGPFTLVLPKRDLVPGITTAGLDTVAVRLSSHPVFAAVLHKLGKPIAAPSANRFGRITPTSAADVLDELDGRIPLILDAGPTLHGIESTIIAVRDGKIRILRRGPITEEELSRFAEVEVATSGERVVAPGQLPTHYAPATPSAMVNDAKLFSPPVGKRVGLLAWNPIGSESDFTAIRRLSEKQDLREAAVNLFRYLRELDQSGVDLIVAEQVPEEGIGAAINDRLRRASGGTSLSRP